METDPKFFTPEATERRGATKRERRDFIGLGVVTVALVIAGAIVSLQLFDLMATGDVVCLEELEHHGVLNATLVAFGFLTASIWAAFGAAAIFTKSNTTGWTVAMVGGSTLLVIEGGLVFLMIQLILWCPA